jgi:outer membrane protein
MLPTVVGGYSPRATAAGFVLAQKAHTVSATFSLRSVKSQTVLVLCIVALATGLHQPTFSAEAGRPTLHVASASSWPSAPLPPEGLPQTTSSGAESTSSSQVVAPVPDRPSAPLPPTEGPRQPASRAAERAPGAQVIVPAPNWPGAQLSPTDANPQGTAAHECPGWQCGDFSREPANFNPWWEEGAMRPLNPSASPLQMELESVVLGTLACSPQVNVMREIAPLREDTIVEKQADFDAKAFVESKFLDTSDPAGTLLVSGSTERLIDQNWYYSNGIRKRTLSGAQIELAQKIGYETSNSTWFMPEANALQGTSRLSLTVTQPLLNGAGQAYNSNLIVLAQIDAQSARDSVSKDLQTLLLEVYQAYWDLHLQRALLLQKRKLYERGVEVCRKLEGRREMDAVGGQLARAKAAVASRYGAVIRQETELLNADAKLRTLMNDPYLLQNRDQELIPMQPALRAPMPLTFEDSLVVALHHRPEINEARTELKAAAVRQDVARNELRPALNLILSTYVSGLEGDADHWNVGKSFGDQFNQGRPTYSTGMTFEMPLGNRAARAKFDRRRLEIIQLTSQLVTTTSSVRLEVEKAVREIKTSYREMLCQAHAIMGNLAEIEYLSSRWEASLDEQRSSAVLLDDLLNAHDRLARSEGLYATALISYNAGFATLNRATGTLVDCQTIRRIDPAYARDRASTSQAPADSSGSAAVSKEAANRQSPQRR